MVEVIISDDEVSRAVRHRTVEEAWYVISGAGEVWRCPPGIPAGGISPARVTAGDALVIPRGWEFQFRAEAGSDLRFICVTMPAWPGMDEAVEAREGGLGAPTLAPPEITPDVEPRLVSPSASATRRYWIPIFNIQYPRVAGLTPRWEAARLIPISLTKEGHQALQLPPVFLFHAAH